ncbi:MAG: InlB B-repeat-containing protein [Clostridia bacterium]|nr:InlB B-repeat-containing protein [Clostridia bacterium]
MKNKKMLVFLLAAVSASAIGAAACKTDKDPGTEHEHSYSWHSNAEGHWEECDCNDKKDIQNHVDVKNNETDADGKDGKCDVCDYALKQTVTFNMGGHGTAPDSQSVDFGATITKPADPEEDAWDFLGWYKDAGGQTAFDFSAPIVDDTVIYAKWAENKTPGESKKYAIQLEVDSDGFASASAVLGKKGVMYFMYTAVVDGRYTLSLGLSSSSAKCYFTTDKDEDGVYYGNGHAAASNVYDLYEGDTVLIVLACDEELPADAQVGIAIQAAYNEPLPDNAWFAGIYANASYTISFDRSENIEFMDTACSYNYLGGSFDTVYINFNNGVYKLQHKDNGTFVLVPPKGSSSTLIYFAELETPVDISEFTGTYKAVGGNGDGITQIGISEDGTGYYVQSGFRHDIDTVNYSAKYGILTYGQYLITLNMVDGSAVSVTVSGGKIAGTVTYERTGDFIPAKLAISSGVEFVGADYSIYDSGVSQYWGAGYGDPVLEVTDYVKATNTYSVNVVKDDSVLGAYKLQIEGAGNDTVIKVYDATGETLVDTLVKYFASYAELPTDGTSATALPMEDFKKNFYHFKATEDGWYTLNCTDADLEVYYNLTEGLPTNTENARKINFEDGPVTIYLKSDAIVGVKSLYAVEDKPETVSLTVGLGTPPKGFVDTNPETLNGYGFKEIEYLSGNYYLTFTPPAAGSYLINVSCISMSGELSYQILYKVNGTLAGFNSDMKDWSKFGWQGGVTADNPYYTLTVADTTPVSIVVGESDRNYDSVKITITKDYKVGAVDLGEFVEGTPSDGLMPASVTVNAGGIYKVADTFGSDLVLTSGSAFTANVNGVEAEVKNFNGTYTATVKAGTNLYVEVSAAVTFSVNYPQGSEKYPVEINLTDGKFTYTVAGETLTYFVFTQAGTFIANCGYASISLNGEYIDSEQAFTVAEGDLLIIDNYDMSSAKLTVNIALSSEIYGKYTVSGADTVVSIGATSLTVGNKNYSLTAVSGNSYTFKAEDGSSVTLVIEGNALALDGQELIYKPVFNADQVGTYTGTNNGVTVTITLNADGSGEFSTGYSPMAITVTEKDGVYTFEYFYGYYKGTITFDADGNIVLNAPDSAISKLTLTKGDTTPVTGPTVYKGIINGGMEWEVTLTLNEDCTEARLYVYDVVNGEGETFANCKVTKNDNTYTFKDTYDDVATFTIDGDTITFEMDYYGSGTLTKQA